MKQENAPRSSLSNENKRFRTSIGSMEVLETGHRCSSKKGAKPERSSWFRAPMVTGRGRQDNKSKTRIEKDAAPHNDKALAVKRMEKIFFLLDSGNFDTVYCCANVYSYRLTHILKALFYSCSDIKR